LQLILGKYTNKENIVIINMIIKDDLLILLILIIIFFIMSVTVAENIENSSINNSFVNIETKKPVSSFEIKIVSPNMLNNVIQNNKHKVTTLKIKKGLNIGVIIPGTLYLRGDLNEKIFPFNETADDDTKIKIGQHLTNIVFGLDNHKIDLFSGSQKYLIWFDAMYTKQDLLDMNDFINQFNDLSETVSIEDEEIGLPTYHPNYNPVPYQYYKIGFVDNDLFSEKLDDRKTDTEQLLKNEKGDIVGIVSKDRLWLQSYLKGDERRYFLLKGLLFSMGFHGESIDKDSFFYKLNYRDTNLSSMDTDAIKLVYGGRIKKDMDMDSIKKALGFPSQA